MKFKKLFLLLSIMPCTSYAATIVDFGVPLCGTGQQMSSGNCVDIKQSKCPSGYYETLINSATYASPSQESKSCMNSYDDTILSDLFHPIYNGVLVDFGVTLCMDGQYLSDGVCVARPRGDCPENFVDITVSDTTIVPRENSECATGYKSFWLAANCAGGQTQHNICAVLCGAGLVYAGTGACVAKCSVNSGRHVTLNSLDGITLPLYASRMTTPSLNVLTSTGQVCYGNMQPGVQSGAINVTVSGRDYHITD